MSVDQENTLYVADYNRRVQKIPAEAQRGLGETSRSAALKAECYLTVNRTARGALSQ
jgi:hypothetical protein